MGKNKLKGRTICPRCHKAFDNRTEGFILYGLVYCADCYNEITEFSTYTDHRKKKIV